MYTVLGRCGQRDIPAFSEAIMAVSDNLVDLHIR
jgi:hypothetical protein